MFHEIIKTYFISYLGIRKEEDVMIFGMPVQSFLAFCIWPIVYVTIAIIAYFVMAKHDKVTDDSEFGAPNEDIGGAEK